MIPIYGISIDSVDLYLSVNRSDNRRGAAVSPDRGQRRRMRRIFQLSVGVVLTEDLTWALGLGIEAVKAAHPGQQAGGAKLQPSQKALDDRPASRARC